MNYRDIFNSSNGYIIFGIILVLFLILLVINRNIRDSFRVVSNIFISSSLFLILLLLVGYIFINFIVDSSYMFFVSIISDSLFSYLFYRIIILLILGIVLRIIYHFCFKDA